MAVSALSSSRASYIPPPPYDPESEQPDAAPLPKQISFFLSIKIPANLKEIIAAFEFFIASGIRTGASIRPIEEEAKPALTILVPQSPTNYQLPFSSFPYIVTMKAGDGRSICTNREVTIENNDTVEFRVLE